MNAREVEARLERYVASGREDIAPIMRALPHGIDDALVARAALAMLASRTFRFARACQRLPAGAIRRVLEVDVDATDHLFLRVVVPLDLHDDELVVRWRSALAALLDLDTTYAWGSKQRRAKLRALAIDPVMLAAIQSTVAHRDDVRLDMLAVLAADGSDVSYDALVGHIDRAFVERDARLDSLRSLRTYATRTPALDALFADVDEALDERNAASPALALGPLIGIGQVDTLWFDVRVGSVELTSGNVPAIQGNVRIDSRSESWFSVWISRLSDSVESTSTSFTFDEVHGDDLQLGRCAPAELPRWLDETGRRLAIRWADDAIWGSNLRGGKRGRVLAWLRAPRP